MNCSLIPLAVAGPIAGQTPRASDSGAGNAAAAAKAVGDVPEISFASMVGRHDQKPGPAWKTFGGTVKQIKGNVYTVEDYEGNQVQLYVSRGTKHLRGNKKLGDRVRAKITHSGFANLIQ